MQAKASSTTPFAADDGRMVRLVRDFDWASTPLGPMADWPSELKTMVSFILESRFPAAIVWGQTLTTIYNDAFLPILGDKPQALGRPFSEVWAEVWKDIEPIARHALAGKATFVEDFPLVIERFGQPEQVWFTFCYSPLRLADGTICGMMDTVVETTATVRTQGDLDTVAQEMGHRLKNTMATVQALASQSLKGVAERGAVEAFLDRVVTLGHAHDVLFRENWSVVALRHVVEATLSPLNGLGQVRLSGPDIRIGARMTMALSLVLHELATNAAKYGALSGPEGRVDLSWEIDGDLLRLHWRETGGPPVEPPAHSGFGSRLIDLGLAPHGVVERRYPPTGVEVDLAAPVSGLLDR